MEGEVAEAVIDRSAPGRVLDAFNAGASHAWGSKPLGDFLTQHKAFDPENGPTRIQRAISAAIFRPLAASLDYVFYRAPVSLYHGVGNALIEAGNQLDDTVVDGMTVRKSLDNVGLRPMGTLARDLVAMPDAFMGSMGGATRPRPAAHAIKEEMKDLSLSKARDLEVIGDVKPSIKEGTPAEAAANQIRPVLDRSDELNAGIRQGEEALANANKALIAPNVPPVPKDHVRFYHGGEDPTSGGGRWVTPDPEYARMFRATDEAPNTVHYVDVRKGSEAEIAARAWDEQLDAGTNMVGRYRHIEMPEAVVANLRPFEVEKSGGQVARRNAIAEELGRLEMELESNRRGDGAKIMPMENTASKGELVVQGQEQSHWRADFDTYVSKLEAPEQVKELIRRAADAGGEFPVARSGELPLAHAETISQLTGVTVADMDRVGMGRFMNNDVAVRYVTQAMLKVNDDLGAAIRVAGQTNDIADLAKVQEAIMRRDLLVEQFVGLRAEWGRTGNVFQEFTEALKADAQGMGRFLSDKKGRSLDDLREIVRLGSELDPRTQLPAFMHSLRGKTKMEWVLHYWTNAILANHWAQLGYAAADMAHLLIDAVAVRPTTALVGTVREAVTGVKGEKALLGETAAAGMGYIRSIPEALIAMREAWITGRETLTDFEKAKGASITQNKGPSAPPIEGTLGVLTGIPSRGINSISSFFKHLNYHAEVEALAYRKTRGETGASPLSNDFWTAHNANVAFPTDKMMERAVGKSDQMVYIQELDRKGQAIQKFLQDVPEGRFLLPFFRTPANVLKEAQKLTPFAFTNEKMRGDLLGKNGKLAQDEAIARQIVGGAITFMGAGLAMQDKITGEGPKNPNDRAIWLLDHQPNSVKIGDWWVSHQRFGQFSMLLALTADVVHGRKYMEEGEYAQMAEHLVNSTATTVLNSVGMKGISDFIKFYTEAERSAPRYVANLASSFLPYSSGMAATAAMGDPYQREVRTFLDAFKNKVPGLRETLFPLRDWSGTPIANSREEWDSQIFARKLVNNRPVDMEMRDLGIKPTKVMDRIHGVKLNAEQYDAYQATAGVMTRSMLDALVAQKNWKELPAYAREQVFRQTIESSRQMAVQAMQMKYPELILKATEDKVRRIQGEKPLYKKHAIDLAPGEQ